MKNMTSRSPSGFVYLVAVIFTLLLNGCSESKPWSFGYVGGLSGKVSDLGGPARNGMLLAVEQANAEGGIHGRLIETDKRDDKQDPAVSKQAVQELLNKNVDVIIGPVTSAMAVEVAPLANQAKTLMMGLTVTTNDLSGQDDYFFRSLSPTATHAGNTANALYDQYKFRRFAGVYDTRNKAYSLSWIADFEKRFIENGGSMAGRYSFSSGARDQLVALADKLLQNNPDLIVFVTNAVDAALLAKLVRDKNPNIQLATSEWAGTERLIELGGRHVEGAFVPQYLDRESSELTYQTFRSQFVTRFNHEPGFPGMVAYNATRVVIEALRAAPNADKLKETILQRKVFPGVQGNVVFDDFGDALSRTYLTQVTNGNFKVVAR